MATPKEQLLSRTVYDTNGTTTIWDFAFSGGYLDPSHVKAYTENALGVRTALVINPATDLIGQFQLRIQPALAAGLELVIYRDTPKNLPLVDFTDESGFSEIALDTNAKQGVFIAAEAIDTVNALDVAAAIAAAERAGVAAVSAQASQLSAASSENAAANSAAAAANSASASQSARLAAESARNVASTEAAAAAVSATSADTSRTQAQASATAAQASATAAADSQTAAANSATAASSSATAAGSSASAANTSATAAAASQTAAATSASAAAGSADSAATSASNAIATLSNFAGRNKIINGKMDIAQRGTSFAAIASATYSLDRWRVDYTASVATISQQADVPSSNEFQSSLRFAVTTAAASIAAGDFALIEHRVEGFNVRDLVSRAFTLSFWVRSSKTGAHCVAFRNAVANNSGDRSFIAEYTINAANTWEFKTVTIGGGLITAGENWNWTTGRGLQVGWVLAAGTTLQTTAGAWQTGNFLATANQVNCLDTIGNIFAITGVQLEVGSVNTPFEHRPYGAELALCQRYYWQSESIASGELLFDLNGAAAGHRLISAVCGRLPVTMRASPTITVPAGTYTNVTSGSFILRGDLIAQGGTYTAAGRAFYQLSAAGHITASIEL